MWFVNLEILKMAMAPLRALSSSLDSLNLRLACRKGSFTGPTAGHAPGFVQGNLAVLPEAYAEDFRLFCAANPKPCPLIGMGEPGAYILPKLATDLDIRTDLPGYRVWQNGELLAETADIRPFWRRDLVVFVLGCSMSFETALQDAQIPIRHIECGTTVPMYRTSIDCTPVGPFRGPMVVSMRPMKPADAIRAVTITSRFPAVHGAPVHIGLPHLIGIYDLNRPDYGDPVKIEADELPVFWACGVTPQAVIAAAKLPFAITHAPGAMLVTDRLNSEFESAQTHG